MSRTDAADAAADIMSRIRAKHGVGKDDKTPAPKGTPHRDSVRGKLRGANTDGPKAPKPEKDFPLCACGCGEHTRGGTYRPGHDSKHKSALAGPKVMPDCGCGCGNKTRGGTFCPGHDAKYYSAMRKAEKEAAEKKKATRKEKKAGPKAQRAMAA